MPSVGPTVLIPSRQGDLHALSLSHNPIEAWLDGWL